MRDSDDAPGRGRDGFPTPRGLGGLLRSLRIENLKSLSGNHEIRLAPLTLVYGPNATGKSSVLQSIRLVPLWLRTIGRALDSDEWEQIVNDHARVISGHDESLQLTVGIAFSSRESDSPPDRLSLAVHRSEHHPLGFRVTVTTSDATGATSTTFESAEEPSLPGYRRFFPRASGFVTGEARLQIGTFFLEPHRGDPREPYAHRRAWVTPWDEFPGRLEDEQINTWLSRMGVPYTVRAVSIEEADPEQADYLRSIDRSADSVDDGVQLPSELERWELTDSRSGVRVGLEDVGYGVGQLLPIIDFCTRGTDQVICIEQPELHLHPRLQGNLGDLLVNSVMRGNQIIAETHSENILLRVRRLIREQQIPAHDTAVIYVDNTDAGATVRRLRLGESGQLLDPWPSGFFDDSLADILGVTR